MNLFGTWKRLADDRRHHCLDGEGVALCGTPIPEGARVDKTYSATCKACLQLNDARWLYGGELPAGLQPGAEGRDEALRQVTDHIRGRVRERPRLAVPQNARLGEQLVAYQARSAP